MAVSNLKMSRSIAWLALFALFSTAVAGQPSSGVWVGLSDSRTLKVQHKVGDLYERGQFKRAYFIYRNELVPIGDKYAQYMVGYMHLTGMGAKQDNVAALAWYTLAAERGTPEFVAVRDQLMHDLENEEIERSDARYRELRREFGDLVLLLATIRRNLGELEARTGSRLASDSGSMTVVEASSASRSHSGVDYYGRIRQRLQTRLQMLAEIGDFPDLETNPDRVNIGEIERLVRQRLESDAD
jgi:hypothetical protein